MTRQEVRVIGAADFSAVQQEISEVTSDLARSATAERFERLMALQKQRDELAAIQPTTEIVTVQLGMTGAEWWETAILEERRDVVSDMFPEMVLAKGAPGRKGFDENRLPLFHGEPDLAYEAWLQR